MDRPFDSARVSQIFTLVQTPAAPKTPPFGSHGRQGGRRGATSRRSSRRRPPSIVQCPALHWLIWCRGHLKCGRRSHIHGRHHSRRWRSYFGLLSVLSIDLGACWRRCWAGPAIWRSISTTTTLKCHEPFVLRQQQGRVKLHSGANPRRSRIHHIGGRCGPRITSPPRFNHGRWWWPVTVGRRSNPARWSFHHQIPATAQRLAQSTERHFGSTAFGGRSSRERRSDRARPRQCVIFIAAALGSIQSSQAIRWAREWPRRPTASVDFSRSSSRTVQ